MPMPRDHNILISLALAVVFLGVVGYQWQHEVKLEAARRAVLSDEALMNERLAIVRLAADSNPTGTRETPEMLKVFPRGTSHIVGEWTRGAILRTTAEGSERVQYLGKRERGGFTFAVFRYLKPEANK